MTDEAGDPGDPNGIRQPGLQDQPQPGNLPELSQPRRPGTFEVGGRHAPRIYVAGWLGTILGILLIFLAALPGGVVGLALAVAGASCLGLGLVAASLAQAMERRHRPDLAYRGPSPILPLAASVPITTVVTLPLALFRLDAASPVGTLASVLVTDVTWITLIGIAVVATRSLAWSEIAAGIVGVPARRMLGDMAWGALTALPAIIVTGALAAFLVQLLGVQPDSVVPVPYDTPSLVLVLLAAAVIAPIGEEAFFRGFATTAWARGAGVRGAIVRGAIFFAAAHVLPLLGATGSSFGQAIITFAARLPVGLALGWIFLRRGSLPASIALHATFNGLLVLAATGASTGG